MNLSFKKIYRANALSQQDKAFVVFGGIWPSKRFLLLSGLILTITSSCNFFNKERKLAKVGNEYLYESSIKNIVPSGYSGADSILIVQTYINQWVKQKLAVNEANANIRTMPEELDQQVEDYRNSLVLFNYQKELMEDRLDTNITNKEIEAYYAKNKANFELKNNIIKVIYVKLEAKSKDLDKVRKWIKSTDAKDRKSLEDWCFSGAINYYFDDNSWLIFDDLLKEIPIKTYDQESFLKSNRFVEIQDSSGLYLMNIKGFKTRDEISPISVEKQNIKNILINQRKLSIVKEMEENLYKKGEFEIYE